MFIVAGRVTFLEQPAYYKMTYPFGNFALISIIHILENTMQKTVNVVHVHFCRKVAKQCTLTNLNVNKNVRKVPVCYGVAIVNMLYNKNTYTCVIVNMKQVEMFCNTSTLPHS